VRERIRLIQRNIEEDLEEKRIEYTSQYILYEKKSKCQNDYVKEIQS